MQAIFAKNNYRIYLTNVIHYTADYGIGVIALKAISRVIDRFCHKHRRFGIPRLMLYIVILSAIVFIIAGEGLYTFLVFHPVLILNGQVWRLITWVFFPLSNNIFFVAIGLYVYFFIGSTLEREWGTAKFTLYYLIGVLLNILYGFLMWFILGRLAPLSPTFLNLSMFLAFAVLFPDVTFRLFFVIPVKVKWLALLNSAFFLYSMITNLLAGYVLMALLPLVALFNFIIFCGDDLITLLRPLRARSSPQTINFKRAARKAKRDMDEKPYRHICAVCGRTDTDNPEMEFRYCSRCNGYHCFCSEHINNHIHFE